MHQLTTLPNLTVISAKLQPFVLCIDDCKKPEQIPAEQWVSTKFIRFVKKYANHTKKTVKICTGGDELGLQKDTPLCENYHRKVTYWLMKEGFQLKKVEPINNRWIYKNERKYYAITRIIGRNANEYFYEEHLKNSDYLNIPCYAVKAWLEYTP